MGNACFYIRRTYDGGPFFSLFESSALETIAEDGESKTMPPTEDEIDRQWRAERQQETPLQRLKA